MLKRKLVGGKSRQNALKKFKVMLNNMRGFKSKETCIKRIIDEENPVLVALVETKLDEIKDTVEIENYTVKRNDRDEGGGGVLIAYKK